MIRAPIPIGPPSLWLDTLIRSTPRLSKSTQHGRTPAPHPCAPQCHGTGQRRSGSHVLAHAGLVVRHLQGQKRFRSGPTRDSSGRQEPKIGHALATHRKVDDRRTDGVHGRQNRLVLDAGHIDRVPAPPNTVQLASVAPLVNTTSAALRQPNRRPARVRLRSPPRRAALAMHRRGIAVPLKRVNRAACAAGRSGELAL